MNTVGGPGEQAPRRGTSPSSSPSLNAALGGWLSQTRLCRRGMLRCGMHLCPPRVRMGLVLSCSRDPGGGKVTAAFLPRERWGGSILTWTDSLLGKGVPPAVGCVFPA